jgi:hypothetical protein
VPQLPDQHREREAHCAAKFKRNRQKKNATWFYLKTVELKPPVSQLAVLFQRV